MNVVFLTTDLSDRTGGSKYDKHLYGALINHFGESSVRLITDSYFNVGSGNWMTYRKAYMNHFVELSDCDYLITNSRLYTRFSFAMNRRLKPSCKILLIHHHFNYQTHSGFQRLVHKQLERAFLETASLIITPNEFTLDELRKMNYENKTILLEAEISLPSVKSEDRNDQVLFIGTCEPRKGIEYGIQAFAVFQSKHPSYKLLIAESRDSYSKYQKKLNSLVSSMGLENVIIFRGRVSEKEKENLLSTSRLFLFPSQNEGYGIALLEAMSHGLPVIAFNNTAIPYTVNTKNGRLVENRNTQAMASALCELIDTPGLWDELSEGAYAQAIKANSLERVDDELNYLFKYMEGAQ